MYICYNQNKFKVKELLNVYENLVSHILEYPVSKRIDEVDCSLITD